MDFLNHYGMLILPIGRILLMLYLKIKKLLNTYQREGTPVYLDIQRAVTSDEYIRFYGVITNMSEDYPVGLQNPKFAIDMAVEFVSEFETTASDFLNTPGLPLGLYSATI